MRLWSDLVALCSSVQQTLLDGKLKQVVILVPQWLTAARTKGGVVWWGLKHRGVHLTVEGGKRHTWKKMVSSVTVVRKTKSIITLSSLYSDESHITT